MANQSDRFVTAFDRLSPQAKKTAADNVADNLRLQIAKRPEARMFSKGQLWSDPKRWQPEAPWTTKEGKELEKSIQSLSNANYWRLFNELREKPANSSQSTERDRMFGRLQKQGDYKLDPEEREFIDRFRRQPFYAVHFTENELHENTATFYSREELKQSRPEISFNKNNTTSLDRARARHDEYTFFSLECGEDPKKKESSFGKNRYRIDFSQGHFAHAWISMNDMVLPGNNKLRTSMPGLENEDYRLADRLVPLLNKPKFVFEGDKIISGIAMTLVKVSRLMSDTARNKILTASDPAEFDTIINGIARPEVKVARSLTTSNFQFDVTAKDAEPSNSFFESDSESNSDSNSDSDSDSD